MIPHDFTCLSPVFLGSTRFLYTLYVFLHLYVRAVASVFVVDALHLDAFYLRDRAVKQMKDERVPEYHGCTQEVLFFM